MQKLHVLLICIISFLIGYNSILLNKLLEKADTKSYTASANRSTSVFPSDSKTSSHFPVWNTDNNVIITELITPESLAEENMKLFRPTIIEIEEYLTKHNLYMLLDLESDQGLIWRVRADEKNNGLSSIKIYVMVAVYEQLARGKINMSTQVMRYGYSSSVKNALTAMIQRSNNEATGALIYAAGGPATINNILKAYLGDNMLSQLAHTPGYAEGGYNKVTMKEQVQILTLLEQGKVVNASSSKQMLDLMLGTSDYFKLKSLSGISSIAQKTAYAPPLQYGIVAKIESNSGHSFKLAMQLWNKNNKKMSTTDVRNIVEIINNSLK